MKEPKPMQEIHEIRKKLYEENKHLSDKQRIQKARRVAKEVIERGGLRVRQVDKAA